MLFIQSIISLFIYLFNNNYCNCFQFKQHTYLLNNRLQYRLKHSNKLDNNDSLRKELLNQINVNNQLNTNGLISNNINTFINMNNNSNSNIMNILSNWGSNSKVENIIDGTWLLNNIIINNKSDEFLSVLQSNHINNNNLNNDNINNNVTIKHYFNSSIGN